MKLRVNILLVVLLAFFVLAPEAQAAAEFDGLYCQASAGQAAPAVVRVREVDGESWLFLPSSTDLSALTLYFDGAAAELAANGGSVTVQSGAACDLAALFPQEPAGGVYAVR